MCMHCVVLSAIVIKMVYHTVVVSEVLTRGAPLIGNLEILREVAREIPPCNAVLPMVPCNMVQQKFFAVSSIDLPDNSHSLYTNSIVDCERACLQNCSCNAYAYSDNCSVWYGDLLNLQSDGSSGGSLFIRLSASEFKKTNNPTKMPIWAFIAFVTGTLACGIVIFLLVRRYQRRKLVLSMNASGSGLVAFRYGDLRRITNNFSERLGRGSFGSVFKGTLPNSSAIAVKKLERIVEVGEKQFRNEVRTIGIIQHINLVRLRGFCSKGNKRLLIYEYMPNGSLDKQLFQRNSSPLNWNMRYQIALGAARGLAYLHESCVDCIIHCDVKPENILLDEFFIPKIADFGMAKLVGRDFSRVITTLRGTIGYLAPEWISGVAITTKIDVYSYGLVLLELVSGRRNSEQLRGKNVGYFPLLAAIELNKGNTCALLDPNLNGDANFGEVEKVCRVACWCIQDEEHNRPTMGQVVQILEGLLEVSTPRVPRSLKALTEHSGSSDYLREHSLAQSYPAESIASMIRQISE